MSKIKTLEQLEDTLSYELAWRRKELTIIKSLVTAKPSTDITRYHIRSGAVLLYAHWEGFIKAASHAYLTYIASQKLCYADLTNNFIAFAAKKMVIKAAASNKVTIHADITEFFLSGLTDKCNLPLEVETKSNLSSDVLREINYALGLNYKDYGTKANLIDETLLKNRNEVAHGQSSLIDVEQFIELHTTIIDLLKLFSNQISNAANVKAYKRTP